MSGRKTSTEWRRPSSGCGHGRRIAARLLGNVAARSGQRARLKWGKDFLDCYGAELGFGPGFGSGSGSGPNLNKSYTKTLVSPRE